jgi:hypothetical protein
MPKSIRPGYHEALAWVALNDDTTFMEEDKPEEIPSVTVVMISHLWDKDISEVVSALRRKLTKSER